MPFMPPNPLKDFSALYLKKQHAFAYKKLMASAMLSGAAVASANSHAALLAFDSVGRVDRPTSGSQVVAVDLRASFNPINQAWRNLTACTFTGTVSAVPNTFGSLPAAEEGVDFILQKQTFSIRTQPYENAQGEIQIDDITDQILFEILPDETGTAPRKQIDYRITERELVCDDGSERTFYGYGAYGAFLLWDPFDDEDSSPQEQAARAIPVRQRSLTSQLESLRALSLHSAANRDKSIAQEINRARNSSGFRMQNLQGNVNGQSLPIGALLGGAAGDALDNFGRWGVFVTGSVNLGKQQRELESDSKFRSSMLVAGVDYHLSDTVILGAAVTHTDMSAGDDRIANTDFKTNSLSIFGSVYSGDSFYLDAIFTYGSSGYDLDRKIENVDGLMEVGAASTDGDETSAALGFGYNFSKNASNLRLFSTIHYIDINIDGYSEAVQGTASAATVDGMDLQSLTASVGVEWSKNINSQFGVFTPTLSLAQERQFADDAVDVTGRFTGGADGGEFYYSGSVRDNNYFNAQIGLNAVFVHGIQAFIVYDTFLDRKDFSSNNLSLGARWQF